MTIVVTNCTLLGAFLAVVFPIITTTACKKTLIIMLQSSKLVLEAMQKSANRPGEAYRLSKYGSTDQQQQGMILLRTIFKTIVSKT